MFNKVVSFISGTTTHSGSDIDRLGLWTFALALATAFLVFVAWWQLRSIKKTSRAEFIKKFNDSFFTEDTRKLITLLFNSALEFCVLDIKLKDKKDDRLPYLKLKADVVEQIKKAGLISVEDWRLGYNAFEVDDLLLGHLDDVGRYEKKGLLDITDAYKTFGYYFELLEEGAPAQEMLDDKDNAGKYEDLKYMQKEFESYNTMMEKDCLLGMLYWHIRHWIKKKVI